MSKKPTEPESSFRPDPSRQHPPIDKDVQLPRQVRHAAEVADALSKGQPVPHTQPNRTRSKGTISYTDAQIDQALQRLDQGGDLKITDRYFETIIGLAREGAGLIKAHRRGAREQRKISNSVTRRQEALIQAFQELSPKRQKYPTGSQTIYALRRAVIQKLGLRDDDDVISEDTIKQDIRQVRPVIRLIQRGVIPPPGKPIRKGISEKTRQEMEEGKRAVTKATAASKPHRQSAR